LQGFCNYGKEGEEVKGKRESFGNSKAHLTREERKERGISHEVGKKKEGPTDKGYAEPKGKERKPDCQGGRKPGLIWLKLNLAVFYWGVSLW